MGAQEGSVDGLGGGKLAGLAQSPRLIGAATLGGLGLLLGLFDPLGLAVARGLLRRRSEVGGGAGDLCLKVPRLAVLGLAGEQDADLAGGLGGSLLVECDAGKAESRVAVGRRFGQRLEEGRARLGEALPRHEGEAEFHLRVDVVGIEGDDLGEPRDRHIETARLARGLAFDEEAPRLGVWGIQFRPVGPWGVRSRRRVRARTKLRLPNGRRLARRSELEIEGFHIGIAGRALLQGGEFPLGAVEIFGGEGDPDEAGACVVVVRRGGQDLAERRARLVEASLGEEREAELKPGIDIGGLERRGAGEGRDRLVHAPGLAGGRALAQEALERHFVGRLRMGRTAGDRPGKARESQHHEGSHRAKARRQWLAIHATNSLTPRPDPHRGGVGPGDSKDRLATGKVCLSLVNAR